MNYIFLINVHGVESCYHVEAANLDEAYCRMHVELYTADVDHKIWTKDWKDLKHDVHVGEQTCFGPFETIPKLS